MKKIFYSKIAVILALATVFTACSDDFLNQNNPNELKTSLFWKDANDLSFGIISVYNALNNQDIFLLREETYRSDLCWPGFGKPNTSDVYYLQIFNNAASAPNLKWGALYKGIFRANQVIEAYERIAPTLTKTADISNAKIYYAEAKALRGLFYFYLYTSFNNGSVPLFDADPSTTYDFNKPLSSAETIKEFYLKDLEYARLNLPKTWPSSLKGRISAGAATALLGQSYLFEKNYTKSTELFKSVINDFGYSLPDDIGSNFTTKDEHNSESILEINYSVAFKDGIAANSAEQVSNTLGGSMAAGDLGGFRVVMPAAWLTMEYKNEKIDTKDPRNTAISPYDGTSKTRKYSLRTSQSLALADDEFTPYYLKPNAAEATVFNNNETSYFRKYTNWDIVSNEKNVAATFFRSGINYRVIRLADVYLMYAESLIQGGTSAAGLDEALKFVNKVRRRSAVQLLGPNGSGEFPTNDHDNITYTATTLMNHLMYIERPLELSIEGHAIRTIDMRRWGIAKARFQDLATRKYFTLNHVITKSLVTGLQVTRFNALLNNFTGAVGTTENVVFKEFTNTAINFDPKTKSYWDIPSSELTSNTSFSN